MTTSTDPQVSIDIASNLRGGNIQVNTGPRGVLAQDPAGLRLAA
jgi:hypothetical protein